MTKRLSKDEQLYRDTLVAAADKLGVIGIIQRSGFKRRAGVVKRTQPRAPKLHVVSRGPGSRGGPGPSRKPEAVRKMIATKWSLNEPAPITLAGPVWSLPPNARPVERAGERRVAA